MVLATIPKPRQTVSNKKRAGQHHRFTKHYAKTYWPYLPMIFIIMAGFGLNALWNTSSSVLGYGTDISPSGLLQYTNVDRAQYSESSLSLNTELSQAAQAKANDMVTNNYWSDVSPDGEQPWQFITQAGYEYEAAGENLAYGFDTSEDTLIGWMNSPEHRANILNAAFTDVGFGIANSPNFQNSGEETIVVAMYAEPQSVVAAAPAPTTAAPVQSTPTQSNSSIAPAPATSTVKQSPVQTTTPTQTNTNQTSTPNKASTPATSEAIQKSQVIQAKDVSRISLLTQGNDQWATLAVSIIASISIVWFIYRHGRLWKRYIVHGEKFVIRHPWFDSLLLAIAVIGFILTRTAGFAG